MGHGFMAGWVSEPIVRGLVELQGCHSFLINPTNKKMLNFFGTEVFTNQFAEIGSKEITWQGRNFKRWLISMSWSMCQEHLQNTLKRLVHHLKISVLWNSCPVVENYMFHFQRRFRTGFDQFLSRLEVVFITFVFLI